MKALPNSLATTMGISVDFFSSSYLDVSVHSVRHHLPIYSGAVTLAGGFPHSDIPGSKLACQLPETLRRLPRPSSPVIAKASTTCTCSLDPITLNPRKVSSKQSYKALSALVSAFDPFVCRMRRYNQTQCFSSRLRNRNALFLPFC